VVYWEKRKPLAQPRGLLRSRRLLARLSICLATSYHKHTAWPSGRRLSFAQAEAQAHKATLIDLAALDREAFEVDKGP
jgi:hypothetical protein